jgi:ribonuclease J
MSLELDADALLFVPLGGAGEIGMNLNLYGCRGRWLMVDLGITFGDDSMPGVDVVMPDPAFIEARRDDLIGLVLTHAHEDHIGAVPYLWPRLKCPIYATPFTASVLRPKLAEAGLTDEAKITEVPMSGRIELDPFALELITLTHSIPEPNAVAIHTPFGTVLHTGDWKLDPDPLVGGTTDEAALRRLGEAGVLAMVCDSTNVLRDGESGSEAALRDSLMELVGGAENRVAIACFSSNVARLETIAAVAAAHGRHAALIGRSLWRIHQAARENGFLGRVPDFITEHDVGYLSKDKLLLACTGSQGEPRAALSRIANGAHPNVVLGDGDMVIFSSRIIPGNERPIFRLHNQLARRGVRVVTERDHFVHVSGHPARDELTRMYQWVRPRVAVPVHGEYRHLAAHAALARECQVHEAVVAENGAVVRLAPGPAMVVGQVASGRLVLDGREIYPLKGPVLRDRGRIIHNGVAAATLIVDAAGSLLADPQVTLRAVLDGDAGADLVARVIVAVRKAVERLPATDRRDDDVVSEAARRAVRRTIRAELGKRPVTDVHLARMNRA